MLLPRPPGGNGIGAVLAVGVHVGLLLALATVTSWRTQENEVVSAELWAAVPQVAAPKPAEAPPPPPAPAAPTPALPPPPPPPVQRDADIATERTKKLEAEAQRQRLEEERKKNEQDKLDKRKREQAEREAAAQKAQQAKADEERLAKQREENLRRIMGDAGSTAPATSTGTAARDAAPSSDYAGRLVALIRRNIVFSGAVNAQAAAEVEVRAAPSGTIFARRLLKSSGNPEWDDAVLRAVDRTATLPRDTDGRVPGTIVIVFKPKE